MLSTPQLFFPTEQKSMWVLFELSFKFMFEQFFAHTEQNETCELNEFDSSGKFHGAKIGRASCRERV